MAKAPPKTSSAPPSLPPSKYGKGWIPIPAEVAATHPPSQALFGAPLNLPAECDDLWNYVLSVYDQGQSSSCVGNAIAKAIHVRLRRMMIPIGAPEPIEPSRLAIYDTARRIDMKAAGMSPNDAMSDSGCVPSSAMQGVRDVGVASEAAWPFDLSKINAPEPWTAFQDASKFLLLEWYRVVSAGASISDALANAIFHGYPVVFGMRLWQAFEDYSGGTVTTVDQDDVGGHMMCILGYRRRADGTREFRVINSWSAAWGEAGYVWVHESVFATTSTTARSSDYYAIQVAS